MTATPSEALEQAVAKYSFVPRQVDTTGHNWTQLDTTGHNWTQLDTARYNSIQLDTTPGEIASREFNEAASRSIEFIVDSTLLRTIFRA